MSSKTKKPKSPGRAGSFRRDPVTGILTEIEKVTAPQEDAPKRTKVAAEPATTTKKDK